MLYFIGGPAKVGKSKLAERLLKEKGIPYLPTDIIMVLLKENGIEKFATQNPAELFFKYLIPLAKHLPYLRSDFCVEGNAFGPKHIEKLKELGIKDIQACFLGMSEAKLETILKHAGPETWLVTDLSEEDRQKYPEVLKTQSLELEKQCRELGYIYIDMSNNYAEQFEKAFISITSK